MLKIWRTITVLKRTLEKNQMSKYCFENGLLVCQRSKTKLMTTIPGKKSRKTENANFDRSTMP